LNGIASARSPARPFAFPIYGSPSRPTVRRPGRGGVEVQTARLGIKKSSPHKLRYSFVTNLLKAGAGLVDIKALLGHESVATTPIDTHVGQERMEQVVARL